MLTYFLSKQFLRLKRNQVVKWRTVSLRIDFTHVYIASKWYLLFADFALRLSYLLHTQLV